MLGEHRQVDFVSELRLTFAGVGGREGAASGSEERRVGGEVEGVVIGLSGLKTVDANDGDCVEALPSSWRAFGEKEAGGKYTERQRLHQL